MKLLDYDRLFPTNSKGLGLGLGLAQALFASVHDIPIVSPYGHTDPAWFAKDASFENPTALFVIPDHYVFRMLYSQGFTLEDLGIKPVDGTGFETDPKAI